MVNWSLKDKKLELVPEIDKREAKHVISWKNPGTVDDLKQCTLFVMDFVAQFSGPHGVTQWGADGIDKVHEEIFRAASQEWGTYPKLTTISS